MVIVFITLSINNLVHLMALVWHFIRFSGQLSCPFAFNYSTRTISCVSRHQNGHGLSMSWRGREDYGVLTIHLPLTSGCWTQWKVCGAVQLWMRDLPKHTLVVPRIPFKWISSFIFAVSLLLVMSSLLLMFQVQVECEKGSAATTCFMKTTSKT